MTERTALRLVFGGSVVLIAAAVLGLRLLGAPMEVIGLAWMLILVGGATAIGHIVVHFAPSHRRRHDD